MTDAEKVGMESFAYNNTNSQPTEEFRAQPEDDVFVMPASVAQERYWLLDQLEPGNTSLNMPLALRLAGVVDVDALRRTLDEIVSRHEVLRTTLIKTDGTLVQAIAPQQSAAFEVIDLSGNPKAEAEADALIVKEAHVIFDLAKGPLFLSKLITLGSEEHILLLTMHHSVCDGWSNGVLVREIGEIYAAFAKDMPSPLEMLAIQYGDFAVWQREWIESSGFEDQLAYWREQLGNEIPTLEIPTDFPRKRSRTSFGAIESLLLPGGLTRAIKALAQRDDVTPYMIFLTAFNVMLHKHCNQEQIVIGSPTANRIPPETEPLIGPFANTLLLRSDLSGDPTISDLLQRTKEMALGAFGNQTLPFEKLVEKIRPARGQNRTQLFQVLFIFQTAFMQPVELDELTITPIRSVSPGSTFDLSLGVVERKEGTRLQMEYNTDLFKRETVRQMLDDLHQVLRFTILDSRRHLSELVLERVESEAREPEMLKSIAAVNGNGNGNGMVHEESASPIYADAGSEYAVGLPAKVEQGGSHPAKSSVTTSVVTTPTNEEGDPIESTLQDIWREMLHVEAVNTDDDFFELGGHSLLAAQIFHEIKQRLGVDLPLAVLLSATTIRDLAEVVRQKLPRSRKPADDISVEDTLKEIWQEMLHLETVGLDDDFFEVGGHSLLGAQIFSSIEKRLGVNLPLSALLEATTIRELASRVREARPKDVWTSLVPLKPTGSKPPLFMMHAAGGNVLFYKDLAARLGPDQPCYGMQAVGLSGHQSAYDRIEDMAAHYISEIRELQPEGPYYLGGSSIGGLIAYEAALQLTRAGQKVKLVVLFDTGAPGYPVRLKRPNPVSLPFVRLADRIQHHVETMSMLERGERPKYLFGKLIKVRNQIRRSYIQSKRKISRRVLKTMGRSLPDNLIVTQNAISIAIKSYSPGPYDGDIVLFRATKQERGIQPDATLGWAKFALGDLEIHEIRGDHGSLVVEPRVRFATAILESRLG